MRYGYSLVGFFTLFAEQAFAAVSLPSWYGDGMVLQTNHEYGARAFLNGKARPGEAVKVCLTLGDCPGAGFETVADPKGDWIVEIRDVSGGKDLNFSVRGEDGPVLTARSVQFGDVYFCGGQSNMVFPMELTLNATAEIATALDPAYRNFRFFTVPENYTDTEQFTTRPTAWAAPDDGPGFHDYISKFSAVCYMTARNIHDIHGFTGANPVGLVFSAVGGTRIESWMGPAAIAKCTQYAVNNTSPVQQNSALFNGMVAPFQYMSVRAVFWYQGEANADETIFWSDQDRATASYACKLQAMIADWRERKGMGDFAWLTVQLPPSMSPKDGAAAPNKDTGRMAVRVAEAEAASRVGGLTDIAGTSINIDMGGASAWGFDHPVNKNEISRRLALQAVHVAFAKQLDAMPMWTGPLLRDIVYDINAVSNTRVAIEGWTAHGLKFRDVVNCTICCTDVASTGAGSPFEITMDHKTWTSAVAVVASDSQYQVQLPGLAAKAVRYAWHDFVECVLVNDADLPMGPWKAKATIDSLGVTAPGVAPEVSDPDVPIQSPPMGFNSWNFYHCNIDENEIKAIADAMATNGMKAAGYQYINIDDCWQVGRDNSTGVIIPDPARFPSGMKAVAAYVHSQQLKFGVYTARGSKTCQNRPGAYSFELVDAATYCDWGLDYLKNDNCGGTYWPSGGPGVPDKSWQLFKQGFEKCFNETGRYIVRSIEYCKDPAGCGEWIGSVANLWRTEGDIQNTWASVKGNIHGQNDMAPIAKPGAFNDPDMLQIGNVGLTWIEQRTHMAYWCVVSAPLLAGTDIVHATNKTLAILTAAEYIAVNQDLGHRGMIQGVLVSNATASSAGEVWTKPLADGERVACLLVNDGDDGAVDIAVTWAMLGLPPGTKAVVRDLWARADMGAFTGSFVAKAVKAHDHLFITVTPSP